MDNNTRDKVEKLKKKQKVLKARIQVIEGREKAIEKKLDTRKKILIGSYFLEKYSKDNEMEKLITIMDKYLIRESDRKVFGLNHDKDKSK
jgi:large subunit ribosomal protein L7/L12